MMRNLSIFAVYSQSALRGYVLFNLSEVSSYQRHRNTEPSLLAPEGHKRAEFSLD